MEIATPPHKPMNAQRENGKEDCEPYWEEDKNGEEDVEKELALGSLVRSG